MFWSLNKFSAKWEFWLLLLPNRPLVLKLYFCVTNFMLRSDPEDLYFRCGVSRYPPRCSMGAVVTHHVPVWQNLFLLLILKHSPSFPLCFS